MAGLLPRSGREALSDHLAEHPQNLLPLRQGQARPEAAQRLGRRRPLRARGGTRERRGGGVGGPPAISPRGARAPPPPPPTPARPVSGARPPGDRPSLGGAGGGE